MPPKLNPLEAIKQSKGAKAVGSLADQVRAEMAAEKAYKAGVHYADPNVKPTMKFSEALGITGSEGKTLNFTETDRSRVKGENMGGFGFSGLQHYSPKHRDANAVWGFGSEEIAKRKIKNSDPEKTVFTTYIGSPDQHKSNSIVVRDALKNVQAANSQNLIDPAQINLINKRIRSARSKTGTLLFSPDFDITDPQAMNAATTFDRRSAISNALMGVGVQGPMKKLDFRKANPNVEYKDPAQMDSILRRETEPMLEGLPNYSVGPRLFTLDGGLLYRPDLNFAFPHQPTGTDMGVMFEMPTIQEAAPQFMKKKGYKPTDTVNARAMSMGAPSQFVSEDYLTYLQKIGRKKGGLAHMAKGGAMRGMKKLKGIYGEVESSMGRGKGAQFEQTASPLNIMREDAGMQFVTKHMDRQLKDVEDQAFSAEHQKILEDALKRSREDAAKGDAVAARRVETFEKEIEKGLARRQWVNSNLKNYVKKQMGTTNDPVRALAEQGVSHVKKMGNVANEVKPIVRNRRKSEGLPEEGLGQSDEAKIWETLSDNTLYTKLPEELPFSITKDEAWMKNLPANEKLMLYGHEPDLGFHNLLEDIDRRMDAGQLRPDQLNKVTVADAVKSLHDERVRKEENSLRAMQKNAATKLHKEYPTGYKWMEISANKDSPLPEGWEQLPNGTYVDPQGQGSIHNPNYIAVQEALEHEGDIMGHCVGDYCDDVYNKGTRILSLRDPRGESHATLQVLPTELNAEQWYKDLPLAEKQAVDATGYTGYNVRHSPQFKEAQAKVPPRIKQIKGKQDAPLIKKYQPMMADLVNTGDWSHVDELHNAGLKEKSKVLTQNEEQWLKANGYDVPNYITDKDIFIMHRALNDNDVQRFAPPATPEAGMAKGGAAKGAKSVMSLADQVRAEMAAEKQYGQVSGMVSKMGEEGRSPILPVPNRWFLQPDKFPNQQKLIERVLEKTGMRREDFPSGAFIDPRTGEVLDSRIMDDLGVVINPATNRPMMSAKGQSGLEVLDPKTGAYTKSNLVRKGLFKPEGGDPMLNDLNFIATIEKGDAGHRYGLATEYASPTELYNTGTGANPTLRPRSRGDLFGVGDVVGQVRIGKSNPHDVYEKLFVAPKGSDVQGKKLSKAHGGLAHMGKGGAPKGVKKVMSLADQVRAEMAMEKRVLPAAEREANLAKFLVPSAEKRRMYHGSKEPNIKQFKTRKDMTDESMMTGHYADERDAVFLSPEPEFTKNFSQMGYTDTNQAPTTYPVYVQIEKPFDFDNPEHLKQVKETYKDMFHNPESEFYEHHILPSERSMALHTFNKRVDSLPSDENNWARIENQDFQDVLKDIGFDSFYTRERGTKNLGVYEPHRIKSAIGNRGTYDLAEDDIIKAHGGLTSLKRKAA